MSNLKLTMEVQDEAISSLFQRELQKFFGKTSFQKQEILPEVLNLKEACKLLSCSKSLIYKLTASRKIPHSKRGKTLYFDRTKLNTWVMENQVRTSSEITNDALSRLTKRRQ